MPRLIGRTRADAPIFEIRSVRLVLHDDAPHFTRLVPCSKCGEEVNGTAVLTPAELDHRASPVLCNDCAGTESPAAFPNSNPRVVDVDGGRPEAPEWRVAEAMQGLSAHTETDGSEQHRAVDVEVDADRVDHAVEHPAGSLGDNPSPLGSAADRLARSQDEMGRRLGLIGEGLAYETERNNRRYDALEARLLEMQVGFAGVVERIARDVQSNETRIQELRAVCLEPDLPRIEAQLNDRLDRLAERAARSGDGDARRLLALEGTVADVARRVTDLGEMQGDEIEHRVRDGLAGVAAVATAVTSRLEVLEGHAAEVGHEMSRLGDLQAVLDGGLGQLRSRLVELTDATKTLTLGQATLDTQLHALAKGQPRVTVESPRTHRRSGGPAETGANMASDPAPVVAEGGLEDKQLKAQLAMLEHMNDALSTTSSATSGLTYLRDDVRALAEQLAAHDEALTRLSRSVERLRRRVPDQPAAPRATTHRALSS